MLVRVVRDRVRVARAGVWGRGASSDPGGGGCPASKVPGGACLGAPALERCNTSGCGISRPGWPAANAWPGAAPTPITLTPAASKKVRAVTCRSMVGVRRVTNEMPCPGTSIAARARTRKMELRDTSRCYAAVATRASVRIGPIGRTDPGPPTDAEVGGSCAADVAWWPSPGHFRVPGWFCSSHAFASASEAG
jgi:hypothetical protein